MQLRARLYGTDSGPPGSGTGSAKGSNCSRTATQIRSGLRWLPRFCSCSFGARAPLLLGRSELAVPVEMPRFSAVRTQSRSGDGCRVPAAVSCRSGELSQR